MRVFVLCMSIILFTEKCRIYACKLCDFTETMRLYSEEKAPPLPTSPPAARPPPDHRCLCVCVCVVCACVLVFFVCVVFLYKYIYMSFEINPVLTNLDRVHFIISLCCLNVLKHIEFRKDSEAVRKSFRKGTAVFGSCFLIILCFLECFLCVSCTFPVRFLYVSCAFPVHFLCDTLAP